MPACPPHHTPIIAGPFDPDTEVSKLTTPISKETGSGMFAWYDQGGPDNNADGFPDSKASYKFPHHFVDAHGRPGAASVAGVREALDTLPNTSIPGVDRSSVEAHLNEHANDFKGGVAMKSQLDIEIGVTEEELARFERVSDGAWDGSLARFTDDQWERACVLDRRSCGSEWSEKPAKERCSLPILEPGGALSRAGVHAAAERVGQVTGASDAVIDAAKSKLRSAYERLGEDAPESIGGTGEQKKSVNEDFFGIMSREFGVEPGVPRHGTTALRGIWPGDWEFREEEDKSTSRLGTLHGHFAVFNQWTEIRSAFEGHFMERIAPGAFKKTFEENRSNIRCLFNHGKDPQIGMKVLGPIRELEEDDHGARYEVPLDDTSYNRDLLPGLRSNQYGASFRFQPIREEVISRPARSENNPDGIEERTVVEMRVREFGPVTFPAYEGATAGVRSLNDLMLDLDLELFGRAHPGAYPDRLAQFLMALRGASAGDGEQRSRETAPPPAAPDRPLAGDTTRPLDAARPLKPIPTRGLLGGKPLWRL